MSEETLQDLVDSPHEVVLSDGNTYKLVYTMKSFLAAEQKLQELGPIGDGNFMSHAVGLWAALRKYHPEVTLDEAIELFPPGQITKVIGEVAQCISEALGTKKVGEGPSPLIGPSSTTSP